MIAGNDDEKKICFRCTPYYIVMEYGSTLKHPEVIRDVFSYGENNNGNNKTNGKRSGI